MSFKVSLNCIVYVLVFICFFPRLSRGFFTSLEPYEEQCYHENVKPGQVWGFLYEVSEGGFLDVDAKLTAPDGKELYKEEKKTDDSYFFTAEQEGRYIFCLANQKSSLVPKTVYFMFDYLNDEKRYHENNENNKTVSEVDKLAGELSVEIMKLRRTQNKLNVRMETHHKMSEIEKLIGELTVGVLKTKRKQEQYEVRMESHHNINVHTNRIVSWWSFFEFTLIIGMALGQVYYIKRFFEVKRVI